VLLAFRGVIAAPLPRDGWRWIVDAHREGCRYIVHSDELAKRIFEVGSNAVVVFLLSKM
jgi:hypothetical protein